MVASYRKAIEWIALNDEPGETDLDAMSQMISVALIADLWVKEPETVAKAVLRYRKKNGDK